MTARTSRSWTRAAAATALAVAALGGVSACSSSPATTASAAAQASGAHVSAADFAAAIQQPGVVVIDVRTPAEFAAGHIAGAKNIDIDGAEFATQIASLDKSRTYALYCHSGRRSGLALTDMSNAGFTHMYDLDGGIGSWTSNGGQLVAGAA
jgi:rhodanese-related sulfurtransferase